MPATVIAKGKKKVIGKAIPVIRKQAENSAKELRKIVSNAKKKQLRRTKAIRAALAEVNEQLSKLEAELKVVNQKVGFIDDIDKQMNSAWPGWYEQGEKDWDKKKDDSILKKADRKVQDEEKRAMAILKSLRDSVATIGDQVEGHEAALKNVMDKLW